MKITINGIALKTEEVTEKDYSGIMDWINNGPIGEISDKIIRWEVEMIFSPLLNAIKGGLIGVLELLNGISAEVITLGIVACAVGMMLAPLLGSSSGKWFGRMTVVFWGGVIWRVLI